MIVFEKTYHILFFKKRSIKGFKSGALKDDQNICLSAFSGEDQRDVWESNAGWTPQHCQVPQVLAGYEGGSGTGMYVFPSLYTF